MKLLLPRFWVVSAFVCAAIVQSPALAQLGKSPQVAGAFRDTASKASQSTVRVLSGGREVALGVVVGADGWILTKHSVLKGTTFTCRLPNGKTLEATLHAHDVPNDLALLKAQASGLTPIELSDSSCSRVGAWVVCPNQINKLVALGVLSVAAREVKGAKYQLIGPSKGYLGASFDVEHAGVKIQDVFPNTPAQKGGLKSNDIFIKVNGQEFQSADEFIAYMASRKPGDLLKIKVERDEMEVDLDITISPRPDAKEGKSKGEVQNNMGSKLSDRRGGFPFILTTDAVIRPEDCGGPLVNLDGKVLGINIARAGRTESYAIPGEVVRPLVEKLKGGPGGQGSGEQ